MDMKIDSNQIRQLRESRGWSQEHLASLSGLSVRTVQRIETSGQASPESKMALAAAFGMAPQELDPERAAPASAAPASRRPLTRHLIVYLLVCSGLVILDLHKDGQLSWSLFPVLGWGLGVLLHARRRLRRAAEVAGRA